MATCGDYEGANARAQRQNLSRLCSAAGRNGTTYIDVNAFAKTGAPIKPVVVLEFVDFYALAVVGRRCGLGHSRYVRLSPLRSGVSNTHPE